MPRFRTPRELILTAPDRSEVERILMEALAQVTPQEIASLPIECRPVVIDRRADTHDAAVLLLQCDLKYRAEPESGELVRQLAELFPSASVRLSQLDHRRFPS